MIRLLPLFILRWISAMDDAAVEQIRNDPDSPLAYLRHAEQKRDAVRAEIARRS